MVLTGKTDNFWTLINFIQILSFIPLTNIYLPDYLIGFFVAILDYNIIPNFFEIFIEESGEPRNDLSERNGYGTNQYLLNCGDLWSVVLLQLIAWPIFYVLSKIRWRKS